MPTVRPRHLVTETDELTAALQVAARRWPETPSRARLLARLAVEGAKQLDLDQERVRHARLSVLRRHHGALAGCYPAGYLAEVRADWPA